MKNKLNKGTYGYLDRLKAHEWKKAALFLSIPIIIFLVAWAINGTRNTVVTVMVIVGCLPGCNQVVHALLASKYHSMDKSLCEETEKLKGDCISIYENVFTTYEKNYYVDCIVLSGRDVIGYASDKNTDSSRLEAQIKDILKKNSYKQNVKIFTEKRAFMDRVESLGTREPEEVPFREDDRYPGLSRDEIVKYLLMAITL